MGRAFSTVIRHTESIIKVRTMTSPARISITLNNTHIFITGSSTFEINQFNNNNYKNFSLLTTSLKTASQGIKVILVSSTASIPEPLTLTSPTIEIPSTDTTITRASVRRKGAHIYNKRINNGQLILDCTITGFKFFVHKAINY